MRVHAKVYHNDDHAALDRLIALTKLPKPFCNEKTQEIGQVVRLWREGSEMHAEIEIDEATIMGCSPNPASVPRCSTCGGSGILTGDKTAQKKSILRGDVPCPECQDP